MTTKTELHPSYLALCDRVEKLDPEAAKYMREEAPKLESFAGQPGDGPMQYITAAFLFDHTPQGHEFWWTMHERLVDGEA